MEYDEQLMQYGIYAKNYEKNIDKKNIDKKNIDEKNIDITGFHIEIIKFNILQKKGVEKLHIKKSSIKKIIFLKENDIDMCFDECLITDPIDAKGLSFKNSLSFITCTFNQKVDFSNSIFNATCIKKNVAFEKSTFKSYVSFNEVCFKTHVDFSETTFEKGVVFNQASFLIEETETNYIEVNFIGTIFKDKAGFPNITFEAMVDFSYAVFENEVSFLNTTFASVVHFDEVKFKNTCDFSTAKFLVIQKKEEPERILFEDITFEGVVNFNDVEFESCIFIRNSVFKNKVDFNNAKFSASPYANNFYNVVFESDIWFSDTIFETVALFEKCKYKGKAYMQNTISKQKITFCESRFLDNAYFNNSTFKDFVNFFQCEFEKTACFYGVTFDKTPNFSQVMFKGNLNIVNANLEFDFNDLKSKIKQEYEDCNQDSEKSQKSLEHFANDFRDSFRIFKNALIKDNNLLDASEFHRCELYCKELELDSKENKTIKDKVEKWQLWFYRKLCDHHTDLVLNLKWLVYTIALYVLLLGKIPYVYPVAIFVFCVYVYMRGFKNVWLIVSSAIVFITILDTPKIILGISNLFEKDLNLWQNFITTPYVIAIGLVLFSLQKTARKNSIVPN